MKQPVRMAVVVVAASLLTGCPVGDQYVVHNLYHESVTLHFEDDALLIPAGAYIKFREYDHTFKRDTSADPLLVMDVDRVPRCWNLNKSSAPYDSNLYFGDGRRRIVSLAIHPDGNVYRMPYADHSLPSKDLVRANAGPSLKPCSSSATD